MRITHLLLGATIAVGAVVTVRPIAAQQPPTHAMGDARTALGFTVGMSGGSRDTLGLLVVDVTPQSPADRAGITEGSRVSAVNGVSLCLAPDEIGRATASDAAVRRLNREVQGARPGLPVVLQVFGGGRRQTITVPVDGSAPTAVTTATQATRTGSTTAGAPTTPDAAFPSDAVAATRTVPAGADAAPPTAPLPVPAGAVLAGAAPVAGASAAGVATVGNTATEAAAAGATGAATGAASGIATGVGSGVAALGGAVVGAATPAAAGAPAGSQASAVVAPAVADARPVMDSAHTATLGAVIQRMGELQQQLHQLARDQRSLALADSLSDAEEDLATLRRRLRSAEARQARADAAHDVGLPGLRLAAVDEDLAAYFGEGSARGLLVVQADAAWDPIRTGDVVLRVDGAPANTERLRTAFDPRRRSTIELLRRRRVLTVTLHGRAEG